MNIYETSRTISEDVDIGQCWFRKAFLKFRNQKEYKNSSFIILFLQWKWLRK